MPLKTFLKTPNVIVYVCSLNMYDSQPCELPVSSEVKAVLTKQSEFPNAIQLHEGTAQIEWTL